MRKAVGAIVLAGALLVALTGCGESLSERAANRAECESLGGRYIEISTINYEYLNWACDLTVYEEDLD